VLETSHAAWEASLLASTGQKGKGLLTMLREKAAPMCREEKMREWVRCWGDHAPFRS